MKYCTKCGAAAGDDQKFCTSCGESFSEQEAVPGTTLSASPASPSYDGVYDPYAPKAATKQAFADLPENASLKKPVKTAGILCYVCAGINVILALVLETPAMLIDGAILLVLGLLIHLKLSKAGAIILLVYGIISVIINFISTGKFQGWLILLAGIYAVSSTFKLDKAWKEYQAR